MLLSLLSSWARVFSLLLCHTYKFFVCFSCVRNRVMDFPVFRFRLCDTWRLFGALGACDAHYGPIKWCFTSLMIGGVL